MEPIINDKRFSHIVTDERFRAIPQHHRKVKIDRRFNAMFYQDQFRSKGSVDKRGRPQSYDTKEDMRKFYDLSSDESGSDEGGDDDGEEGDSEDVEEESQKKKVTKRVKSKENTSRVVASDEESASDDVDQSDQSNTGNEAGCSKTRTQTKKKAMRKTEASSSSDDSDSDSEDDGKGQKSRVDYARGRADVETSSSDDGSSDDDNDALIQPWGELDKDAPREDEISRRLAVCNIDWDQISARDLYLLLGSFVPTGGMIKSVQIYLSEFGKERLAEEDMKGPKELVETGPAQHQQTDQNGEVIEKEELVMERMRLYQLNRLKYYYAVAEFDSAETALKVYEDCDGQEYEVSACRFDMRFIPDDMIFDEEPHSFADQGFEQGKFKPKEFSLTALQNQKVDITWDQTDPSRVAMIQRVFNKDAQEKLDLEVYLASSSEEDDGSDRDDVNDRRKVALADSGSDLDQEDSGDEEANETQKNRISKYRSLLADLEDESKKKEKQDVQLEITWNTGLSEKSHPLIQKILDKKEELSPWEQFLERKKLKKKHQKKNLENDDKEDENSENPYSDDELPDGVDIENDPFFKDNAININPKKEKESKKKKKKRGDVEETEEDRAKQAQLELLLLDDENEATKNHFSLKKLVKQEKKKWGKNKKKTPSADDKDLDDFQVNVSDPRFSAIYESHLFNIDPSQPQFKKTKAMDALVQEKQKRRIGDEDLPTAKKVKTVSSENATKEKELSMLIKSVKNKSSSFKTSKKAR